MIMKKALVMTLAMLFLFGSLAFAAGGKVQGDEGQGTVKTSHDPLQGDNNQADPPFDTTNPDDDWPGIDW
jgi:ABC-type oligopeptide transport system substrate-binding subunit